MREDIRDERQLVEQATADELSHPVAVVTLAHARDRGVDGDDQPGVAGHPRPLQDGLGGGAAADQVELEEHGARRRRLDVLETMARDRREAVAGAGLPGRAGRPRLAVRMHHPRVADRGQHEGQRELLAQDAGAQVGRSDRHRLARAERHVLEGAAILAQRHLPFRAAIEVVEDGQGQAAPGQRPQILHADDTRRGDLARGAAQRRGVLFPASGPSCFPTAGPTSGEVRERTPS